jgi:hypothetical protein
MGGVAMILYEAPAVRQQEGNGRTVRLRVTVADPAGVGVGFYWLDVPASVIRQVARDWGHDEAATDKSPECMLVDLLAYDYGDDILTLLQDIEAGPTVQRVEIVEGHDE